MRKAWLGGGADYPGLHSIAVHPDDPDGGTLAFGSTSGALWLSDNQGDAWQALSEHLPPVYCVRFVETA